MKRLAVVCICLGVLSGRADVGVSAAERGPVLRTWTDDTGRHSVVAELIDFQNEHVRLKKGDGKVVTVLVSRLSEADRRYLAQLKGKRPDAAGRQPLGGKAVGPHANGANADQPKTGICRFQVFGLMHAGQQFTQRYAAPYTVYRICEDCWNVIEAEEGYRELRRYLGGGRTGELEHSTDYSDPRKVRNIPWEISTYPDFPLDTDLAPIAKAVLTAETPHRWARAFYVVLYVTPKANQGKAIQKALAGLPGVDARKSAIDVKAGRIHVRISGQKPIRITDLVAALQKAGVEATTWRGRR